MFEGVLAAVASGIVGTNNLELQKIAETGLLFDWNFSTGIVGDAVFEEVYMEVKRSRWNSSLSLVNLGNLQNFTIAVDQHLNKWENDSGCK